MIPSQIMDAGRDHAATFERLRSAILDRLVDERGSIDPGYQTIPGELIRQQFDVVLSNMLNYLETEDPAPYRAFVTRWGAMGEGHGVGRPNVINTLVAIGDVIVKLAHQHLDPSSESAATFTREIMRMSFYGTRVLVDDIARELGERQAQLAAMEGAMEGGG